MSSHAIAGAKDESDSKGAEGSASDEAAASTDQRTRAEGSASDEAHPTEENRRADDGGHR